MACGTRRPQGVLVWFYRVEVLERVMVAALLVLIAGVYLLAAVLAVAALRGAAYSHARHTISELAEAGSEYSGKVSYGVFLPVACALAVAALLAAPFSSPVAALALSLALGYGSAALFPCDPGSPAIGSFRQGVHNLGGAAQYLGGALSLLLIAEALGWVFRAAGLLVAGAALLLSFEGPVRGLIQRVAELCLFLGLLTAVWMTPSA
ncbi:MAG: DUF998 domain-containing protein [Pseudomonadota bacterium]